MPPPSPLPTYLYKILPDAPPSPLPERLPLSDLDRKDGYIHLSTAKQVPGIMDRYYGGATQLWLFKIEYKTLEAGTGGDGRVKEQDKARLQWDDVGHGWFAHFYSGDLGKGNILEAMEVDKRGTWAESLELEW